MSRCAEKNTVYVTSRSDRLLVASPSQRDDNYLTNYFSLTNYLLQVDCMLKHIFFQQQWIVSSLLRIKNFLESPFLESLSNLT